MGRKRKPLPFIENVTIEAVAAEGKCITRVDDQVIFVPFCVPGDVVDLQVVKKKHKYCEAKVVRFIKKSDVRQEPMVPPVIIVMTPEKNVVILVIRAAIVKTPFDVMDQRYTR